MNYSNIKIGRLSCLIFVCFIVIIYVIASNSSYRDVISSSNISKTLLQPIISQPEKSDENCQWQYDHYLPSEWESYWYNNIGSLQEQVCQTLTQTDHRNKSIESLQYIMELQKSLYEPSSIINQADVLLSKMYYRFECDNSLEPEVIVFQSIEPLIGLLRDPLTICSHTDLPESVKIAGEGAIQSKRFFLLGPSAPYINYQPSTPTIPPWLLKSDAQVILFDIGSSYFNGMNSTAVPTSTIGTRWFYEYFRSKSLSLDRIFTFEAAQYEAKSYWNQIPDDIIGRLTFINAGVEADGKLNPWNILKTIAKPEDYVIIKLDIDTSDLELALCNQILNNASISSLIDEMFFEMHVTVNEMRMYWDVPPGELRDTYVLFRKLRELGIRMHSWP